MRRRHRPAAAGRSRRRDDLGLMSLEFLLLVAAVMGAGITASLVVQGFLDERAAVAHDPEARVVEADIAAARIAQAANVQRFEITGWTTARGHAFRDACRVSIPRDFPDVVVSAQWMPPRKANPAATPPRPLPEKAKCELTLREDLGG